MSTIHSPFQVSLLCLITLQCFHWLITYIALGDLDLRFSLMLVRNAIALEEDTKWAAWYHHCNQSTCDWWHDNDVMFCQPHTEDKWGHRPFVAFALNQKLLHKLKNGVNFQVAIKQNRIKWDLSVQAISTELETQKRNGTFVWYFIRPFILLHWLLWNVSE